VGRGGGGVEIFEILRANRAEIFYSSLEFFIANWAIRNWCKVENVLAALNSYNKSSIFFNFFSLERFIFKD